jgi:hypothetical protein
LIKLGNLKAMKININQSTTVAGPSRAKPGRKATKMSVADAKAIVAESKKKAKEAKKAKDEEEEAIKVIAADSKKNEAAQSNAHALVKKDKQEKARQTKLDKAKGLIEQSKPKKQPKKKGLELQSNQTLKLRS